MSPAGLAIVLIGVILIVLGWRGTYKQVWGMITGK